MFYHVSYWFNWKVIVGNCKLDVVVEFVYCNVFVELYWLEHLLFGALPARKAQPEVSKTKKPVWF